MKSYVKPEIRYENFALSESIAQACDASSGNWIVRGAQNLESCYAESNVEPGVNPYASAGTCNQLELEEYCITLINSNEEYVIYSSY